MSHLNLPWFAVTLGTAILRMVGKDSWQGAQSIIHAALVSSSLTDLQGAAVVNCRCFRQHHLQPVVVNPLSNHPVLQELVWEETRVLLGIDRLQ